jgi:spermidine synthase
MMSVYEYSYFLEFLPYGMNPDGRSCLVIGLGAGIVPAWYEQRGIRTDVVDIDPDVVSLARKYFGFSVSGEVYVEDARYFLNRTRSRYDYVILDVFNGDTTPGHILSREALEVVRQRMSDRGILAINLIGSLKREPFMTASIIRTLQQVFDSVEVHPNYLVEEEEGGGNITVLASPMPMPPFDPRRVAGFPVHPDARNGVARFLGNRYRLPEGTPAVVLTDDYNPIDFFDVRLKEWVRSMILKNSEVDILL